MVFGPRYLYEALPFLILLNARGVEAAIAATSAVASRFMSYPAQKLQQRVAAAPVVLFVLVLVIWSTFSWLTGRFTWHMDGVPSSAAALEGVDRIDNHLARLVEGEHLHNALIVVVPCIDGFNGNICYSSVFWQNAPTLDGDVVYVVDLGARNDETYTSYPCRNLYFATYLPPQIEARGQTPPSPGSSCS